MFVRSSKWITLPDRWLALFNALNAYHLVGISVHHDSAPSIWNVIKTKEEKSNLLIRWNSSSRTELLHWIVRLQKLPLFTWKTLYYTEPFHVTQQLTFLEYWQSFEFLIISSIIYADRISRPKCFNSPRYITIRLQNRTIFLH